MHRFGQLVLLLILLLYVAMLKAEEDLIITGVELQGLKSSTKEQLLKGIDFAQKPLYSPETSEALKQTIQANLQRQGFYFARIELTDLIPSDTTEVVLVYRVEEGNTDQVGRISFRGNRYFTDDKLRQLIRIPQGMIINLRELPGIMQSITTLYANRGYLFAETGLDSLSWGDAGAEAVISINEGPLFSLQSYRFSGNKVSKPKSLLKISGLSLSDKINPDIIAQAEENLLSRDYIKACKITPLDKSTLLLGIEESSMTRFEGLLGLNTGKQNNKNSLNGYLRLHFLNLWGTDRALNLNWNSLSKSNQTLELNYHESGPYKYPLAGDISFFRAREDSAWVRTKAGLSIYYNRIYQKLGADVATEQFYPDYPDSLDYERTSYLKGGLFWRYMKNNRELSPTLNHQLNLRTGLTYRKTGRAKKYIPVTEVDAATYYALTGRLVYSIGGHYREISDKQAKLYEQYKLGGYSSLRGYNEEVFSGWRTGWINSELGYLLTGDSRIYLLLDNGMVQTAPDPLKWDLMATGIGLSLQTRVGIINFSYALPIEGEGLPKLSSGLIHLGLNSGF